MEAYSLLVLQMKTMGWILKGLVELENQPAKRGKVISLVTRNKTQIRNT